MTTRPGGGPTSCWPRRSTCPSALLIARSQRPDWLAVAPRGRVSGVTLSSLASSPTARAGARDALPFAAAGFMVAISFGISARSAGMPGLAAIAMSAFVYAGSAQFAAVAILSQGGSVIAAVLAAMLMNARYLAMGLAIGPS